MIDIDELAGREGGFVRITVPLTARGNDGGDRIKR
jgi:hypothetical protein